jgi:hypothetical protein
MTMDASLELEFALLNLLTGFVLVEMQVTTLQILQR